MNDYDIGGLMEEMELKLIASMKRNLKRHLKEEQEVGFTFPQWQAMKLKELKKYQRENKDIIDGYTKGLDKNISNHLKRELTQGSINSIKKHNDILGTDFKASKMLNNSFFKTNDKKVNALINVVNNDLNKTYTSALRMINDEYRQIIHKSAFFLANGTVSQKQAIDMATKEFLSRGLNCIEYKDGRRVNIASYSEMAVRTASLRAQLMGDGDFRKTIGRTLVIGVASNEACPLCTKWENKVMIDDVYSGGKKSDGNYPLLSEAMKKGFLHPNCRDGVATYYPELEDIEKSYEDGKDGSESDQAYQDDLNYINQQIKKYTRLETGSLDDNNIKTYRQKRICYEKKKESILMIRNVFYDTQEWKDKATPNSHKVKDQNYFEHNGVKYLVDNKNVVLDYSFHEKEIAEWLEATFGGEIYMLPRVNNPSGIETADYLFRNEYWDLKEIVGNGKHTLDSAIKKKKSQANNFILDISNSKMTNDEAIRQLNLVFKSKDRQWVKKIILKRNKEVIAIAKHKKRD